MFAIAPAPHKLNVRNLAAVVYRAIRMGWTPDVVFMQDWPQSDYVPLVDSLSASMSQHDFNTFSRFYAKTANNIYHTARGKETTEQWFAMYRKLTGQKEPAMQTIQMTIITSWEDEELIATVIGAADNIVNDFKIDQHTSPVITSHRRTDDNDIHMYWVDIDMSCEDGDFEDVSSALRDAIFDDLGNGFVISGHQGFVIGRLNVKND